MVSNEPIRDAIVALNNEYGRGTLRAWRLFADGRITATFEPFNCRRVQRRGRLINGRTVRMFGHQRTVEGR